MEPGRREFLQQISGATVLAVSGSLRGRDMRAGPSQDKSSAETQTIGYLESLRAQFPVLAERVNGNPLVYLDSAATTQRPRAVIDALSNFYLHDNANPEKTLHALARRTATQMRERGKPMQDSCMQAHHKVAVLDLDRHSVLAKWVTGIAFANYPMAFDEADHRLFVVSWMRARLLAFHTENGKVKGGENGFSSEPARFERP